MFGAERSTLVDVCARNALATQRKIGAPPTSTAVHKRAMFLNELNFDIKRLTLNISCQHNLASHAVLFRDARVNDVTLLLSKTIWSALSHVKWSRRLLKRPVNVNVPSHMLTRSVVPRTTPAPGTSGTRVHDPIDPQVAEVTAGREGRLGVLAGERCGLFGSRAIVGKRGETVFGLDRSLRV